jgi:hypothetical protein
MLAKYHGRDAHTGASIRPGDEIIYCTATRTAWHTDEDYDYTPPVAVRPYQSDVLISAALSISEIKLAGVLTRLAAVAALFKGATCLAHICD